MLVCTRLQNESATTGADWRISYEYLYPTIGPNWPCYERGETDN